MGKRKYTSNTLTRWQQEASAEKDAATRWQQEKDAATRWQLIASSDSVEKDAATRWQKEASSKVATGSVVRLSGKRCRNEVATGSVVRGGNRKDAIADTKGLCVFYKQADTDWETKSEFVIEYNLMYDYIV